MSRPIYEPSLPRADAELGYGNRQLFRRPSPISTTGALTVFRAAMGSIADPEADRVHYPSGDGGDNVYWDQWDTTFNTSVFDTGPYEQTINGINVVAGVGLLQLGLYSIHAQIDVDEFFNGITLFQSNYDEGQSVYAEHNNLGYVGEPFLGDYENIRLDHWREVVSDPSTGPTAPGDHEFGGEATTVEIVFAQNMDATVVPYGGVTAGKYDGIGNPPLPGQDLWIPGGYDGAWGYVPNLLVVYWGLTDGDPDWPASFPK